MLWFARWRRRRFAWLTSLRHRLTRSWRLTELRRRVAWLRFEVRTRGCAFAPAGLAFSPTALTLAATVLAFVVTALAFNAAALGLAATVVAFTAAELAFTATVLVAAVPLRDRSGLRGKRVLGSAALRSAPHGAALAISDFAAATTAASTAPASATAAAFTVAFRTLTTWTIAFGAFDAIADVIRWQTTLRPGLVASIEVANCGQVHTRGLFAAAEATRVCARCVAIEPG